MGLRLDGRTECMANVVYYMHNPHHGIISFINVCDHFTDKHHCWWKLKYIQGMPQSISRVINDYGRWYSGRSSMAYWKEKDQNGTAGGDYLNTRIRYSWTMPLYKSSLVSVRVHEEVLDGSWHWSSSHMACTLRKVWLCWWVVLVDLLDQMNEYSICVTP